MQEGGKAIVCSELVRLDGPASGDALASMAASLLLPDLPVFLVWNAEPDFERPVFRALRSLTTRLVTDSTRFPATLDRARRRDRPGSRGGHRPGLDEDHRLARGGGVDLRRSRPVRRARPARARRDRLRRRLRRAGAAARRVADRGQRLRRRHHHAAGGTHGHAGRVADARRARLRRPPLHRRPAAGGDGRDRRAGPRDAARGAARAAVRGADRRGARVPHHDHAFHDALAAIAGRRG